MDKKFFAKIRALITKHQKDVAPLISKDEPAVARPAVAGAKKLTSRFAARQKFKSVDEASKLVGQMKTTDKSRMSDEPNSTRPASDDEKEAGMALAAKKKDGEVTIDPTEEEIGNPEVGNQQAESIAKRYFAYIKNI